MSNENESGKVSVGGAFSGESKWILILGSASAGALLLCLFGTFYFMGRTLQASNLGLIFGLFAAGSIFVGGMVALYVEGQIKMSPYHHHMLVVQPDGIIVNTHFTEGTIWKDIDDTGELSGYRSRQFKLDNPMELNLEHAELGLINEYEIHYYGEWDKLSELRQGNTVWHDMDIPVGSMDILFVEYIGLNTKHGAHIPAFKLIGGRFMGRYFKPELTIPNPETKNTYSNTQFSIQPLTKQTDLTTLQNTINTQQNTINTLQTQLDTANEDSREFKRHSLEDKKHGVRYELIHELDDAESQGKDELIGDLNIRVTAKLQRMVRHFDDWYDAFYSQNQNKWSTAWPYILALAALVSVLVFLGFNPKLMSSAVAATQNWLLDIAVIAVAAVGMLVFYYLVIKRKSKGKR